MVRYLPRSWWTDEPSIGHVAPHEQFTALVVHHTVFVMGDYDRDGFLCGDLDDIKRYMLRLKDARPDLGPDVPYSFVHFYGATPDDGIVVEGRGPGRTGAHTAGFNSKVYGCAFAGNGEDQDPTAGLLESFREVGRRLAFPLTAGRTRGHRDIKATACPGRLLYARLGELQPPFFPLPTIPPVPEVDMPEYLMRWDATGHVFGVYPSGRVRWIASGNELKHIEHANEAIVRVALETEQAFNQALADAHAVP